MAIGSRTVVARGRGYGVGEIGEGGQKRKKNDNNSMV